MPDRRDCHVAATAVLELLEQARAVSADQLPAVVAEVAGRLGARDVQVLLADPGQQTLVPFGPLAGGEPLGVDRTAAGLAYRRLAVQVVEDAGAERLWVPIVDGSDRLGVLGLTLAQRPPEAEGAVEQLADLLALLLIVKHRYNDSVHRVARRQAMSAAAEMQWSQLPPLNAHTAQVAVAGMLQPCYDIGGDVFDYAVEADRAQLAIIDAAGHDLSAAMLSAVALGAYRTARRRGADLAGQAEAIERVVAEQFGHQTFVTAILATVELATGTLSWLHAGHPRPLLVREGRSVIELSDIAGALLGMGISNPHEAIAQESLQPGDCLLLYSDGLLETANPSGERFGAQRLTDFLARAGLAGEPLPETVRRLDSTFGAFHGGELHDDATLLVVQWQPPASRAGGLAPSLGR